MQKLPDIPNVTFNQVLKSPSTFMLMVAVSILWIFVMKFGGATDTINRNCETEKQQLRAELVNERKEKGILINALLVKSGVIDAFVKATDSLNINVGEQTKDIVKKNRK